VLAPRLNVTALVVENRRRRSSGDIRHLIEYRTDDICTLSRIAFSGHGLRAEGDALLFYLSTGLFLFGVRESCMLAMSGLQLRGLRRFRSFLQWPSPELCAKQRHSFS
jgi:hypothetical protein